MTAIAPAPPDRVIRAGIVRREAAADWLFAGVMVLTAWWYLRASRGQSFLRDDWAVATRSLSFGDLIQPHNNHLSIIPLAIYRVLLGVFGMETYTPERLLGSGSLLLFGVALFLFARSRVGAPVALVVAVSVLWLPTTNLTPFLANFHFALVCAVVCAAVMPAVDWRSDVVIGLALSVAFASSSVGLAVAAACAAHAVMSRARLSRWLAVAVPSLLWVLWWRTLGRPQRASDSPSVLDGLGDVADGVFESFKALTGGWWLGGVALLGGWALLLLYRVSTDPASTRTQLAWTGGLVTWWVGLVWSRPGAADSFDTGRYAYVGAVLIILSALPTRRVDWLTTRTARWRMAAPALVVIATIILGNHDELRTEAQRRVASADRAEMVLYELEAAPELVEPAHRLPLEMAGITVRDYRENVVPRYGSPIDVSEAPDEALIERSALHAPIMGPAPEDHPACAVGIVALYIGHEVVLQTGDQPAMVRARRFGSSMHDVRRVPAGMSAVVRFPGPTLIPYAPWVIDAPGACIHVD